MKTGQRLWTREELILAINLYCKLPFGKLHRHNPEIIELADLLGRTSNSVALKLVNFASLDPSIRESGRTGAVNSSKLDKEIWNEFYNNWDVSLLESEYLRALKSGTTIQKIYKIEENELPKEGIEREQYIKTRVNQYVFRKMIMAAYDQTCCITGINIANLLVASHIRPWSLDSKNRMNPRNGLALNALHDKAFEAGLLTITPEYKIKISSKLLKSKSEQIQYFFSKYNDADINEPERFKPDPEFLDYHNQYRFVL